MPRSSDACTSPRSHAGPVPTSPTSMNLGDELTSSVWRLVSPAIGPRRSPVVLVSGPAENTLGAALIGFARGRVGVGLLTAAFFIAVFPGNIAQYLDAKDAFGLDTDRKRLVRLFFQPVLVLWALWSSGAWRDRPTRSR